MVRWYAETRNLRCESNVQNRDQLFVPLLNAEITGNTFPQIHYNNFPIAPGTGVDICECRVNLASSTVERVGKNKQLLIRSRLSDPLNEATRAAARPEKAD
jgi:hypothetical protein